MIIEVKSIWLKPKQRLFRIRMMLKHHLRTRYGLLRRATEERLVSSEESVGHVELINA